MEYEIELGNGWLPVPSASLPPGTSPESFVGIIGALKALSYETILEARVLDDNGERLCTTETPTTEADEDLLGALFNLQGATKRLEDAIMTVGKVGFTQAVAAWDTRLEEARAAREGYARDQA